MEVMSHKIYETIFLILTEYFFFGLIFLLFALTFFHSSFFAIMKSVVVMSTVLPCQNTPQNKPQITR